MPETESYYVRFTEDMKKEYTILTPNMLTLHFRLMIQVLRNHGYRMELLETDGPEIVETGLKYVHNDTCYPAILVIGQFISALQSGRYDPHKVALIYFQTGGGCRASNYINLLRKALKKAGLEFVPVISMSLSALEDHPGFKLSAGVFMELLHAVLYGDLLMSLHNQCKPYELNPGQTDALADDLTRRLAERIRTDHRYFSHNEAIYKELMDAFGALPRKKDKKLLVGIVGEIYIKYSPLGNNHLEQLLVDEGAEVVTPGLFDFLTFGIYVKLVDTRLYGINRSRYPVLSIAYRVLLNRQRQLIEAVRADGRFRAPTPFTRILELSHEVIDEGVKMGEGWLLPAEMLELNDSGVHNVICAQPFGCLPNHIVGKGMMKPIKEKHPEINLVAIDYDPGATRVNQENRIRLMLSNASRES
ncbi:MAG: 2-hydroxyacyl-CoA dehydratase [Clostridia bacterium]|nr:2-hydroxyacyl-CoA dehydratase [Clostridia bacterium]